MTVFLINEGDISGLNGYMRYLREFPEYVEAFKIVLELVPASEYGKYREPVLDPVVAKAAESATFWSANLTPLRDLHRELYQQMKDLTEFYTAASRYGAGLDRIDRKALITHDTHYRELAELSRPLKLANTRHVMDILSQCNDSLLERAKTFQQYGSSTSTLHQNIYTIIPRIIDFMNSTLQAQSGNAPLSGPLQRVSWILNSTPLLDPGELIRARGHITSTERNYANYTAAASNMSHYFYRLEQLLIDACHPLANINDTSTLADLSLAFTLAGGRLKEFRNLSEEMTTLLQYSY